MVQAQHDIAVVTSSKGLMAPLDVFMCSETGIGLIGHIHLSPSIPAGIVTRAFAMCLEPLDLFLNANATLSNAFQPLSGSVPCVPSRQAMQLSSTAEDPWLPAGSCHLKLLAGQHAQPSSEPSIFSSAKKKMDMVLLSADFCIGGPAAAMHNAQPERALDPASPSLSTQATCKQDGAVTATQDKPKIATTDASASLNTQAPHEGDRRPATTENNLASPTGAGASSSLLSQTSETPIAQPVRAFNVEDKTSGPSTAGERAGHNEARILELLQGLHQHLDDRLDGVDASVSMLSQRLQRIEAHLGMPRLERLLHTGKGIANAAANPFVT